MPCGPWIPAKERCSAPYRVRKGMEKWYVNIVKLRMSAERYVSIAGMNIVIQTVKNEQKRYNEMWLRDCSKWNEHSIYVWKARMDALWRMGNSRYGGWMSKCKDHHTGKNWRSCRVCSVLRKHFSFAEGSIHEWGNTDSGITIISQQAENTAIL